MAVVRVSIRIFAHNSFSALLDDVSNQVKTVIESRKFSCLSRFIQMAHMIHS